MLSINTNISSLIAQQSMSSATNKLNQAIERMTTGYKINGAKDNAANYSISQNMQTQLSSYDVAADNVAMGMDLVTTASDIISNMQDKASRLQALCTQARNGTYGEQSMSAINSEAAAIMAEINRLYSTAEYNGISLFDRQAYDIPELNGGAGANARAVDSHPVAKTEYNGFIENPVTYTKEQVEAMTELTTDVDTITRGGKYAIYNADQLAHLASLVNGGKLSSINDVTFVLADDIDLKEWCDTNGNWIPIGYFDEDNYDYSKVFHGTFDGNGHVISNLKIDSSEDYQGLFGYALGADEGGYWGSLAIRNVGLEEVDVKGGSSVGALVGSADPGYSGAVYDITNNYATGTVSGAGDNVGGLVGVIRNAYAEISFSNNYATCFVTGQSYVGGLVGSTAYLITSSYATGSVSATGSYVGGLVGSAGYSITNSYATGSVCGSDVVGGLAGVASDIINSYATGNITGINSVGGLVGCASATYATTNLTNNYATGAVSGTSNVGGLVGYSYAYDGGTLSLTNNYATGTVSGQNQVGGLVGEASADYYGILDLTNNYATGTVSGTGDCVGGFVGSAKAYESDTLFLTNNYATGSVSGTDYVGGLVGYAEAYSGTLDLTNNYATGAVSGTYYVGGLVGGVDLSRADGGGTKIVDCASYSKSITGTESLGSLIGGYYGEEVNGWSTPGVLTIENCSTISELSGIGGYYMYDGSSGNTIYVSDYDLSAYNEKIAYIPPKPTVTTLQVGIKSDSSCQITFDTNFKFDLSAIEGNIASDEALAAINDFTNLLSEKSTQLGAVQNRLDSALESITVNMENLTSSLSTIRDADIAEVSSLYIQQQILQQASATLLATANQSPSIALQLI